MGRNSIQVGKYGDHSLSRSTNCCRISCLEKSWARGQWREEAGFHAWCLKRPAQVKSLISSEAEQVKLPSLLSTQTCFLYYSFKISLSNLTSICIKLLMARGADATEKGLRCCWDGRERRRDTGRYALWPLFFSPLTYAYVWEPETFRNKAS